MAFMINLSCNILEKPSLTVQKRLRVQKKDSYLNNILILGHCVGESIV